MKFINLILAFLLCGICFAGCSAANTQTPVRQSESPHLYWKDTNMEIVEIEKYKSLNGVRREVHCTLYSKEYDQTFEFNDSSVGMARRPQGWDYEAGDTVEVEVDTYVYDSTGEVVDRFVDYIY